MFTTIKNSLLWVGTLGLVSLSGLLYAKPSQAADIDLSTWQQAGDVIKYSSSATLTNARDGVGLTGDDGIQNFHISTKPYTDPLPTGNSSGSLNAFLGIPAGVGLPNNAVEGSAIKGTITANKGDVFQFNYIFRSNEPAQQEPANDYAFVTINGNIVTPLLATVSDATIPDSGFAFKSAEKPFTYHFDTTGNFDIAIGVVDAQYSDISSSLAVTNPTLSSAADSSLQPVPEPMTIMGSMMAIGCGTALRRRFGKT